MGPTVQRDMRQVGEPVTVTYVVGMYLIGDTAVSIDLTMRDRLHKRQDIAVLFLLVGTGQEGGWNKGNHFLTGEERTKKEGGIPSSRVAEEDDAFITVHFAAQKGRGFVDVGGDTADAFVVTGTVRVHQKELVDVAEPLLQEVDKDEAAQLTVFEMTAKGYDEGCVSLFFELQYIHCIILCALIVLYDFVAFLHDVCLREWFRRGTGDVLA